MTFAFTNPFLSFLEPHRWAESIIAINEPFCIQETSHFNFRHGVFDTRICEFPFHTENYKLSCFFYRKSAWAINQWKKCSLYTDMFYFSFCSFRKHRRARKQSVRKKIKNVSRHLWEKRGLLSPSSMSVPHYYHLCIHGTNRIGPVELEI